jgi:hypothetical protein
MKAAVQMVRSHRPLAAISPGGILGRNGHSSKGALSVTASILSGGVKS